MKYGQIVRLTKHITKMTDTTRHKNKRTERVRRKIESEGNYKCQQTFKETIEAIVIGETDIMSD